MQLHPIVSRDQWLAARTELLAREKELTHQRDRLNAQRRELPWVKIDKDYVFDGRQGKVSLAELFAGRSQLIVYHFMLGPDWEEGCVGCSFLSDHVDGARQHLERHDVSYVAISRAPQAKLEAFKRRMGWEFRWVSSFDSDFNYDFHVSFRPGDIVDGKVYYNYRMEDFVSDELSGTSVFYKDEAGDIYHTYSAFARGDESSIGTYMLLDLTPKGRNETGPRHDLTDWVRHHDRYDTGWTVDHTGRAQAAAAVDDCCGHST